jgi:hypothetical protein
MTRIAASHRSGLIALGLAAIAVIAGLLIAGFQTIQGRTYSLRVPDSGGAGIASASHRVCEGPIRSPWTASGVAVFADPATGRPTLAVRVFAGGRLIASGSRTPSPSGREQLVALDHPIRAGQAVQVCIATSGGTLTVYGAGAQAPAVVAHGLLPGMQFSLVLTHSTTLIGSLSRAFSRAAIFRPSWVGAWTFWLLLALLGCTLPLAGVALLGALDEPEPDENSRAPNGSS